MNVCFSMSNQLEICYKSCGNYILTLQKLPDTITNESRSGVSVELNFVNGLEM
jgi:hypothetical protein